MEAATNYIPQDRRQAIARGEQLPDRASGAALFADISGFTPLTESLARQLGARRGSEELTRQLNQVYGALIAEVEHYGGSIIGFSGDAITCWFSATDAAGTSDEHRSSAAAAALRAATCGLAMQQVTKQFAAPPLVPLAIKVAVASGPVRRLLVGDPQQLLFDVLAGRTLERLAAAEHHAMTGEVVLDRETADALGDLVEIATWRSTSADNGAQAERFAVLGRVSAPALPDVAPTLPEDALAEDQVRPWVLPTVYQRLQNGQGAFIAELRPAVALFLRFGGIDYDHDPAAGTKLDAYVRWVQGVTARYGGALLQLTVGDKGSYLYITFGAPTAHDDDPARAVAAALSLQHPPPDIAVNPALEQVQIGVSMGMLRTGAYGSATRSTYGALGDEVNLAARLMERTTPGQIIVTRRVANAAGHRYEFRPLGTVQVKGKLDPIPMLEVVGLRAAERLAHPGLHTHQGRGAIVGRSAECELLSEHVARLRSREMLAPVLIEGDAGIGKSRLVEHALEQARSLGLTAFVGLGDAIERSTPYHVWRAIVEQLLGLDGAPAEPELRRAYVLDRLEAAPELLRLVPLLNAVLPLNIPENELTEKMSGEVRANNTAELLAGLFSRAAAAAPLLIVIEDAHWMDSASPCWASTSTRCSGST